MFLISSELPELIALSTRVLVLRDGHLVGELARAEADPQSLLRIMAGFDLLGPRLREIPRPRFEPLFCDLLTFRFLIFRARFLPEKSRL